MPTFSLDGRLAQGSTFVGELDLCQARLQHDRRFPWLVLVPRRAGGRELEDLAPEDRASLMTEILAAGRAVRAIGPVLGPPIEKLNVGALGNIVPQLHVHVVGRHQGDAAWPGPVWGFGAAQPYVEADLQAALAAARAALGL